MKQLLEDLTKSIVKHPEDVVVEEIWESSADGSSKYANYIIKVNDEDKPLIIGKGGRTIKSIRNVAKVKAVKDGIYVNVNLEDDRTEFGQEEPTEE